ncbi:MAG TPA: helix-hairpin-helix domain-containing protein [Thermodesulfobacteriaceae bacterium]|nr:helix-hairpin-helix domain-containing protein [Thermodesulfobacteriaceae bacterium]
MASTLYDFRRLDPINATPAVLLIFTAAVTATLAFILFQRLLDEGCCHSAPSYVSARETAALDVTGHNLLFFRPMDLNGISQEELTLLAGIGEVSAARIINYRNNLGFFISAEDLEAFDSPLPPKVYGIIKNYVYVDLG